MKAIHALSAAAALAILLCAGAGQAQRAYPSAATPRVAGTPLPMDPAWAFAFDPLMEEPMWSSVPAEPSYDPTGLPGDPAEAARLADSMRREMAELRRMGDPDAIFMGAPAWGRLDFDTAPVSAASSSSSAWSYSSETDERGCTRTRQMSQQNNGAPQVSAQTSGPCQAPAAPR